jgi:hypothetical protein
MKQPIAGEVTGARLSDLPGHRVLEILVSQEDLRFQEVQVGDRITLIQKDATQARIDQMILGAI